MKIAEFELLSFFFLALGYFLCATPAVASFCLLTAVGVIFDYLFQITFYSSIMIYGGRKEETGGLMGCCYRNKKVDDVSKSSNSISAEKSHGRYLTAVFSSFFRLFDSTMKSKD